MFFDLPLSKRRGLPDPRPGRRLWICRAVPGGAFFAPLRGALDGPPPAAGIAGSRPGRRFWICRAAPGGAFFAPLRGALDVPPPAAGIAGSRPGRRVHFLIAQEMDERRALKGGSLEEDGAQSSPPLRIPPPLTSSGVHKEGKYKPPKIKNGHLYRCPQSDLEKNFRFNMQCVADIKQRCNRKRHFNIGCLNMA